MLFDTFISMTTPKTSPVVGSNEISESRNQSSLITEKEKKKKRGGGNVNLQY